MRKWVVLFLLVTLSAAPSVAQDLERRFEKSFAETPKTVALRVARGVVEVVNAPAGAPLRFVVDLRVQDPAREQRSILERMTPDLLAPFKRDVDAAFKSMEPRYKSGGGNRIEMTLRDPRPIVFDRDPALQMVILVKVEVPAGVKLEVRSVAAGVMIGDYRGAIDLRAEGGSLFVDSVDGDLIAKTTSGSITVGEISGSADLRTASGSILTGKLRGPAKLRTANGDIEVQQAFETLSIEADDSEIILGVASPLPKKIDLQTSAGMITVNVDRNLPLTVDAATRLLGKVRTRGLEPTIRRGSFNESSLLADFNGGGGAVKLRTSWGNIVVVGREPLDG